MCSRKLNVALYNSSFKTNMEQKNLGQRKQPSALDLEKSEVYKGI